jgi:hypothetical protein
LPSRRSQGEQADALLARFHAARRLPGYIEYHRARQTFERELSQQWPAIRAAFANDQHLMMNDSERIPDHERTADRTDAAAQKAAA